MKLYSSRDTECPICMEVVQEGMLNKHVQETHNKKMLPRCPTCYIGARRMHDIRRHMRNYHSENGNCKFSIEDIEPKKSATTEKKVLNVENLGEEARKCYKRVRDPPSRAVGTEFHVGEEVKDFEHKPDKRQRFEREISLSPQETENIILASPPNFQVNLLNQMKRVSEECNIPLADVQAYWRVKQNRKAVEMLEQVPCGPKVEIFSHKEGYLTLGLPDGWLDMASLLNLAIPPNAKPID